ncbi:MAG: hypothetical protein PUC77_00970, partial [Bacteroidales bacterium]|nr:hypothetical protein [Bacteroidales bacterium]MDD6668465.1 hypothetical protein [Bacteroidales bacterium]
IGSENALKPEIGQQADVFIFNLTHMTIRFCKYNHKSQKLHIDKAKNSKTAKLSFVKLQTEALR